MHNSCTFEFERDSCLRNINIARSDFKDVNLCKQTVLSLEPPRVCRAPSLTSVGTGHSLYSSHRLRLPACKLQLNAMVGTKVSGSDANEPILQDNPDRFCMFPIKYTAVWEMYKKAEASFWTGMLRCGDVTQYFAAHANKAAGLPDNPSFGQRSTARPCLLLTGFQPCQVAKPGLVICVLCLCSRGG